MSSSSPVITTNNLSKTYTSRVLNNINLTIYSVALHEIPYSDDFKASWVYFSTPLDNPGEILSGMLKAIFVRLFVPGYLIISAFILFIWGVAALDDIFFGLFNNFLMLIILAMINKRHLPLSMAPNVRSQTGNLMRGLLTFSIIAILGVSHYLLTKKPLLLLSAVPLQLGAIYFLHRSYKRTGWNRISF